MDKPQKKKQQPHTKRPARSVQITAMVLIGLCAVGALFNIPGGGKNGEKPDTSPVNIWNGQFSEEYNEFRRENLKGGKALRSLDSAVQNFLGKRESKGVYKGKDHYLMEEIAVPDEKDLKKKAAAIEEFDQRHYNIPTYVMLVPNAAGIWTDKLPGEAVIQDQTAQFSDIKKMLGTGIHWVDVENTLKKHRKEELYYHTDSRWTVLGAQYGWETLIETMGLDASELPKMKSYIVNNDFTGDLAGRSGYEEGYEESLSIYAPEKLGDSVKVMMTNQDTKEKSATLYDVSKLEKDNKYDLFLGGDCGMINIKTTADTTDRLLIFKDSYANCLIPMLTPYYREIVAIDPSMYEGSLQEVMKSTKFTSVLFLYNGNSFVTDSDLEKLLNTEDEDNASE